MNPLIVLTAVFATAMAAPSADYATGYANAPIVHAAPAPVPVAVPAPYTTAEQGAPTTTIHQAPAVVSKQLHFGQTQFVSGYAHQIHKPATPVLPIAVPTALLGSVTHNAPLVKIAKEPHVVNEPYAVERRVEVPYDAPVVREQVVEVPVAYHVDRPYAVPHPVPVRGEDIVNYRQTAPVVHHTHTDLHAAPVAVAHATPVAAYAQY